MCSITTNDMYSRTAFTFEPDTLLCPFLLTLDNEESRVLEREEAAIATEMPNQRSIANAALIGVYAGVGIGLATLILVSAGIGDEMIGSPATVSIVSAVVVGVIAGLGIGDYIYEHDNSIRNKTIAKLEINRYRMTRLDDKVSRITMKLLEIDLPDNEKQQLRKASCFLTGKFEEYRAYIQNRINFLKPAQT